MNFNIKREEVAITKTILIIYVKEFGLLTR
jgi:hypothetical protein